MEFNDQPASEDFAMPSTTGIATNFSSKGLNTFELREAVAFFNSQPYDTRKAWSHLSLAEIYDDKYKKPMHGVDGKVFYG